MRFTANKSQYRPVFRNNLAILLATTAIIGISSPVHAMTVNAIWDQSVLSSANAAEIEAGFNAAAQVFDTTFANPVTININVGWGEINGNALSGSVIGASQNQPGTSFGYAQLYPLLAPYDATLPKTMKGGPGLINLSQAQARALGAMGSTAIADGSVGFNSSLPFDFTPGNASLSGKFDFVGTAVHEISEVLGRASLVNGSPFAFSQAAADLFRYSAPGKRSYSYYGATYFSLDGGITNLGWFNNGSSGDRSDWLGMGNDAQNAYGYAGVDYTLSNADILLLDALGYAQASTNTVQGAPANGVAPGINISSLPANLSEIETFDIPEPGACLVLAVGLTGLAFARRRATAA